MSVAGSALTQARDHSSPLALAGWYIALAGGLADDDLRKELERAAELLDWHRPGMTAILESTDYRFPHNRAKA